MSHARCCCNQTDIACADALAIQRNPHCFTLAFSGLSQDLTPLADVCTNPQSTWVFESFGNVNRTFTFNQSGIGGDFGSSDSELISVDGEFSIRRTYSDDAIVDSDQVWTSKTMTASYSVGCTYLPDIDQSVVRIFQMRLRISFVVEDVAFSHMSLYLYEFNAHQTSPSTRSVLGQATPDNLPSLAGITSCFNSSPMARGASGGTARLQLFDSPCAGLIASSGESMTQRNNRLLREQGYDLDRETRALQQGGDCGCSAYTYTG